MRQKLTARLLDKLAPGGIVRDVTVPGMFAERSKTGSVVSLKIQADLRPGTRTGAARKPVSVRMTLGQHPELSLDAARAQAQQLLGQIKSGVDPRVAAPDVSTVWTVGHAYSKYIADLAKRAGTDLSRRDLQNRLDRYLGEWKDTPLEVLTKETVEQIQMKVAADIKARATTARATGARTANAIVSDLSTLWDYAADYTKLPNNPCRRITPIGHKAAHHEIPLGELPAWWAAVGALKNPLRRAMQQLGLLSGLRPSNLTGIERAWIDLPNHRINFPAESMKNREAFVLPLSSAMVAVVRDALAASQVLFPGARWLFAGRGADGEVQQIAVVREKPAALKNRTGHALRHTWKNAARAARISEMSIETLLSHRQRGIVGMYGSFAEQFERFRADQETVSTWILARCQAAPAAAAE